MAEERIKPLKVKNRIFDWKEAPYFVGILNVTPDSFSDGGEFLQVEKAVKRAKELVEEGADIIDIGGESSRPFSDPVPEEEELKRVIPVIKAVKSELPDVIISIDTYKSRVAEKALEAGADIVNDISAGRFDPDMVKVVKEAGCPVILMHMKGTPKTMQINPFYKDVIAEIKNFLKEKIEYFVEKGVDFEKIIIDPGIGFGKRLEDNLKIIRNLDAFLSLNRPVLLGHSRKSFIGEFIKKPPRERDFATAGVSVYAVLKGIHFLRVHSVKINKDAVTMFKILNQE
jgi:dihydropteroate synthase